MREFHLQVVTPDGSVFDGSAESLLLRTDDGDVEILAGHVDYIASLGTGRARIRANGKDRFAACSGGFVSVEKGEVMLVAVTFEFRENIDLARAKLAKENAEEKLRIAKDDKAILLAKAKLRRAVSRINVAELK